MNYRPLGNTGLMVSALSFGCMRLKEDQEINDMLINRAIDLGINYFETSRRYLNGKCQHKTAPGIKGKEDKLIISGKYEVKPQITSEIFLKEIECQLKILNISSFKFFQVGGFYWNEMPYMLRKGGVLEAIRKAQNEGLIQYIGMTSHDLPDNVIKCLETGLFSSVTLQYNLINRIYENAIKRASELGIGVVIMNPLAGGVLALDSDALRKTLINKTLPVELALGFVLSNKNVSTVCSGMNVIEHLEQNVNITKNRKNNTDTENILKKIENIKNSLGIDICTACQYCMPCPNNVDISNYMTVYRDWVCFVLNKTDEEILNEITVDRHIFDCSECRICEEKCPNKLPIVQIIRKLKEVKYHSGLNC
jgi:predicted aldo/keto reductase-like oxidoreductase